MKKDRKALSDEALASSHNQTGAPLPLGSVCLPETGRSLGAIPDWPRRACPHFPRKPPQSIQPGVPATATLSSMLMLRSPHFTCTGAPGFPPVNDAGSGRPWPLAQPCRRKSAVTRWPSGVAVLWCARASREPAAVGWVVRAGRCHRCPSPRRQLSTRVHDDLLGGLAVLAVERQAGGQENAGQLGQPAPRRPPCRPPAPLRKKVPGPAPLPGAATFGAVPAGARRPWPASPSPGPPAPRRPARDPAATRRHPWGGPCSPPPWLRRWAAWPSWRGGGAPCS